jgi:hypothetical protein
MAYKNKNDPRKKEAHLKWYYNNKHKQMKRQADRKREIAFWFAGLKENMKCNRCEERHIACLDFHHLDSKEKEESVSKMVCEGFSMETILAEIKKCEVLCANCHRKHHHETDHRRTDGERPPMFTK